MRHGRAKAARKTLQYFKRVTGLTPPYRILLDATIIATLFQQHVLPVRERIDKVLQTFGNHNYRNMYCISKSAVEELEMIHKGLESKKHPKALDFQKALEWIRSECKILDVPTTTTTQKQHHDTDTDPNLSKEKNKNDDDNENENEDSNENPDQKKKKRIRGKQQQRQQEWTKAQEDFIQCVQKQEGHPYVVGSQDEALLDQLRNMGTVPIIRLANQSVLILEQPSKQSQQQAKGEENRKWKHNLAETEKALVDFIKKENKEQQHSEKKLSQQQQQNQQPTQQRMKGKAKGPNPLSCKRKQQDADSNQNGGTKESASKKRRKRAKKQSNTD